MSFPFPHGYRFCPSDTQIIHHLMQKIMGIPSDIIPNVDVLSLDPDQIPFDEFQCGKHGEWFFFSNLPSGNLVTQDGYWHPTATPTEIKFGNEVIGFKRMLTFHWGIKNGVASNYVIHEYSLGPNAVEAIQVNDHIKEKAKQFVVCRLRNMDTFLKERKNTFLKEEEELYVFSSSEEEDDENSSTKMDSLEEKYNLKSVDEEKKNSNIKDECFENKG